MLERSDFSNADSTYRGLYGLVDGIDVSIGSIKYIHRFQTANPFYELSNLPRAIIEHEVALEICAIGVITGLSLAGHLAFTNTSKHRQFNKIWPTIRNLLKSGQYAIKSWLCLSPLINVLKPLSIETTIPVAGLAFVGLTTICRVYNKLYLEKINKITRLNNDWVSEQARKGATESQNVFLNNYPIKTISKWDKYKIRTSALLSGAIDRPQMFYSMVALAFLAPTPLIVTSSLFAIYCALNMISSYISTEKQLIDLELSEIKKALYYKSKYDSTLGQAMNYRDDIRLFKLRHKQLRLTQYSKLTITLNKFDRLLLTINFVPMLYIYMAASSVTIPVYLGGLLLGIVLVASLVALYRCQKESKYEIDILQHKDKTLLIIASLALVFINYFKGIRISNFAFSHLLDWDLDNLSMPSKIISIILQYSAMALLSIKTLYCSLGAFFESEPDLREKELKIKDSSIRHTQNFTFWSNGPINECTDKKPQPFKPIRQYAI